MFFSDESLSGTSVITTFNFILYVYTQKKYGFTSHNQFQEKELLMRALKANVKELLSGKANAALSYGCNLSF